MMNGFIVWVVELRDFIFYLHLSKTGSLHAKKNLVFRDLRSNSDVAHKYYNLKKFLSKKYELERRKYTEAKSEFINKAIARAMAKKDKFV